MPKANRSGWKTCTRLKRELLPAVVAATLWNSVSSLAAQTPPVVAPPLIPAQTRESPLYSARASQFADSVLKLMTLDEKIGQLNQLPGIGTQTGPRAPAGGEARSPS